MWYHLSVLGILGCRSLYVSMSQSCNQCRAVRIHVYPVCKDRRWQRHSSGFVGAEVLGGLQRALVTCVLRITNPTDLRVSRWALCRSSTSRCESTSIWPQTFLIPLILNLVHQYLRKLYNKIRTCRRAFKCVICVDVSVVDSCKRWFDYGLCCCLHVLGFLL